MLGREMPDSDGRRPKIVECGWPGRDRGQALNVTRAWGTEVGVEAACRMRGLWQ